MVDDAEEGGTETSPAYSTPFIPFHHPALFRTQNSCHITQSLQNVTGRRTEERCQLGKREGEIKHLPIARTESDMPDPGSEKTGTALALCFQFWYMTMGKKHGSSYTQY